MSSDVEAIPGFRVDSHNKQSKLYDQDRICAEFDCETKLSKYNPNNYCWVHGDSPAERVATMKRSGGRGRRTLGR